MLMNRRTILFITLLFALFLPWGMAFADPILFLSTQLTPVPEATMMRQVILKDFPQSVDFEPYTIKQYTKPGYSQHSEPERDGGPGRLAAGLSRLVSSRCINERG